MSDFTPEPWEYSRSASGINVYEGGNHRAIAYLPPYVRTEQVTDANAALITAAPDMYEALKNVVAAAQIIANGEFTVESVERLLDAATQAELAIAKAEGKVPA